MANIKEALAGVSAVTITLASLGNYASRQSTAVVNTVNLYLDYEVTGKITTGSGVSAGDVYLLLYGSDGTYTSYPAGLSDAAITVPQIDKLGGLTMGQTCPGTNLIYYQRINTTGLAAGTAASFAFTGIANAFALLGGNIPPQWGLVVVNCSGQALDSTGGNHVINQNGVYATNT